MKIDRIVLDALNGKGVNESIYALFPVPPSDRVETRPNLIFRLCAEKRVIHLGCTDHLELIDQRINSFSYLHQQLTYAASECIGVDINEEAVAHVKKRGIPNVVAGDITKPGIKEIENGYWDWLLMADVLEHIPDPVGFLRSIEETYGKYFDRILITVPNAYFKILGGIESFTKEIVNYDHFYYFTPYTLCRVVHSAGLTPEDLFMCSYENPAAAIREFVETYKKYPLVLETIALTTKSKSG